MSPAEGGGERDNWQVRRRRTRKRRMRRQRERRKLAVQQEKIPYLRRRRRTRERHLPKPPAPFVIGMTRSGTTLLRLMLDSHPDLTIPPETDSIPDVIKLFGEGPASPEEVAAAMTSSRRWGDFGIDDGRLLKELGKLRPLVRPEVPVRTFYRLYAKGQGKPRWGATRPRATR